jgi:hypothetical protein
MKVRNLQGREGLEDRFRDHLAGSAHTGSQKVVRQTDQRPIGRFGRLGNLSNRLYQ